MLNVANFLEKESAAGMLELNYYKDLEDRDSCRLEKKLKMILRIIGKYTNKDFCRRQRDERERTDKEECKFKYRI